MLKGYELYHLGSYPGIWPGDGQVIGEVWFVDEETLNRLDDYEGEGVLYRREQVPVSGPAGELSAEVYICVNRPKEQPMGDA